MERKLVHRAYPKGSFEVPDRQGGIPVPITLLSDHTIPSLLLVFLSFFLQRSPQFSGREATPLFLAVLSSFVLSQLPGAVWCLCRKGMAFEYAFKPFLFYFFFLGNLLFDTPY